MCVRLLFLRLISINFYDFPIKCGCHMSMSFPAGLPLFVFASLTNSPDWVDSVTLCDSLTLWLGCQRALLLGLTATTCAIYKHYDTNELSYNLSTDEHKCVGLGGQCSDGGFLCFFAYFFLWIQLAFCSWYPSSEDGLICDPNAA